MTRQLQTGTVPLEKDGRKKYLWVAAGILFAVLWASASTATKIGLAVAQPLVIAVVRFGVAALCMLVLGHLVLRQRLPAGKEWKQLAIYGVLNVTIYLGCYVMAMQTVTAGIGALAVATNPLFISFMSVFIFKQKLSTLFVVAMCMCMAGVLCAAWPLFGEATVTAGGLAILFAGMLAYSAAALYFSKQQWNGLHLLAINGWQTAIGGALLLPFAMVFYNDNSNRFDATFWGSVLWLALPVSIVAVQLWLWLLRTNATRAGMWLFLCPLFGFAIARWLVHDRLSGYTAIGVLLVILGLAVAQRSD
ncbi:DMT family transporter [Pseudocnuella soli]|uniref:DMT family transporter n=1 Tax=Pseudocnuella soli TaxID=2502779 RepID=UPI00104E364D|nr:DMT family transporter [Pseudocnuella soli]